MEKIKTKKNSPTEYAKDKVEHEERSDNDERHEERPVEHVPDCIVRLKKSICRAPLAVLIRIKVVDLITMPNKMLRKPKES